MSAASTINRAVMVDMAYRHVFGRAVEQTERSIIRAMQAAHLHLCEVTASDLTAAVSFELGDCSKPTAINAIQKACRSEILIHSKDQGNETKKLYRFGPGIAQKLKDVELLERRVNEVIVAQAADPSNKTAGNDLIDPSIYFHCEAEENAAVFKKIIECRKSEFRGSNQNKRRDDNAA